MYKIDTVDKDGCIVEPLTPEDRRPVHHQKCAVLPQEVPRFLFPGFEYLIRALYENDCLSNECTRWEEEEEQDGNHPLG